MEVVAAEEKRRCKHGDTPTWFDSITFALPAHCYKNYTSRNCVKLMSYIVCKFFKVSDGHTFTFSSPLSE